MVLGENLPIDLAKNQSFSQKTPGLQIFIDSTSLGSFKTCPRKYFYEIIWGFQSSSVHLDFGIWLHQAREEYDKLKVLGFDHEMALKKVLEKTLKKTWNFNLSRPWFSDHKLKNRNTLLRTIIWYLDAFGKEDPFETLLLTNGKPAVELTFKFSSGIFSSKKEEFVFCGHLDRIARAPDGELYILDIKTTGQSLGPGFFAGFSPDNQMTLYTLAGRIAFGEEVRGVVVDGCQIGADFSRFERQPVLRPLASLEEWLQNQKWWLRALEDCALTMEWPQNDKACNMYGGCRFRNVCSKSPGSRKVWLESDFVRKTWDPSLSRE